MRAAAFLKASRLAPALLAAGLLSMGAVAAAARPAAAQDAAVETFDRTVPLPAGGSFSLSNVNGAVEIEGWDRDAVRIIARKSASLSASDLGRVGITVTPSGRSVSVVATYPEGGGLEVNVDFHVMVPARVVLASVTTVNGSVTVHDVSGAGEIATINGSIKLVHSAGLFSARATNGNVFLELLSVDGGLHAGAADRAALRRGISAQTVNGAVTVSLPQDAGAELEARTQNGDFASDLPVLAHTSAAGRLIRGRVNGGGVPLYLRTVNGSIRLRISRPLV